MIWLILVVHLCVLVVLIRQSWRGGWDAGYRQGQRDTAVLKERLYQQARRT